MTWAGEQSGNVRTWTWYLLTCCLCEGVVPLCSLGDPWVAHRHAAGSEQGGRGQHQRRLLCGTLQPRRPALLRPGPSVHGRHHRPLPHPGRHRLAQQRASGHPARRAQPGEAEEVHDSHRRVQLPLPGSPGYPVGVLHVRAEPPQCLGENLDRWPLSGVQHPLPFWGTLTTPDNDHYYY